jgi:hypothetical protein
MTSEHHIFRADAATCIGPPKDAFESDKIEWIPLDDIRSLIDKQPDLHEDHLLARALMLA